MTTEDKIMENMGVVSDKLVQYMDAAEKVITQYGGDAVNLGLNVLRIEAAGNVLTGVLLVIFGGVVFYKARSWFLEGLKISNWRKHEGTPLGEELRRRWLNDEEVLLTIEGAVLICVFGIGAIIGLLKMGSIWNWVGIFWPEAYAVHKFLM